MNAANPDNEKKRLNVLWQYEVLDTVPEALFDDLTELAAGICEVGSSRVDLQACKLEYSIVSPK